MNCIGLLSGVSRDAYGGRQSGDMLPGGLLAGGGFKFLSAGPRLTAPIGCLVKFLLVDYFTDLEPVNAAVRR